MSLELWSTIASVGTFVVITATAIAAIIQLVHIRSSNQISILTIFRKEQEDPEFRAGMEFISTLDARLEDPTFRRLFTQDSVPASLWGYLRVVLLYEDLGYLVKRGILDAGLFRDLWGPLVIAAWNKTARATAVARRTRGLGFLENFEYLTLLSRRFAQSGSAVFPKNAPRIDLEDPWAEQDGSPASSIS